MIDIHFAILLIIMSILVPGNIIPMFAYYFIWFIYYIYVINQTLYTTNDNCKCEIDIFTNSIIKPIVLVIFSLLVLSSLVLFNQLCHGENELISMDDLIKLNTILLFVGATAFYIFYISLPSNCNCNNKENLKMINVINLVTMFLQVIFIYLLM